MQLRNGQILEITEPEIKITIFRKQPNFSNPIYKFKRTTQIPQTNPAKIHRKRKNYQIEKLTKTHVLIFDFVNEKPENWAKNRHKS